MKPMPQTGKKRKRKKNKKRNTVATPSNSEQSTSENSEKTHSDSGSEILQCNKTKKLSPIAQSESDSDKHSAPAPKQNTESATLNRNTKRDPPTTTHTNMTQEQQFNLPTSNRYETLNEEEIDDMDEDDSTQKPPPPIIIHSLTKSHKILVQQIRDTGNSTFTIKYTKNTTNVTIHDRDQRKTYMNTLKQQKIDFHTYTDKADKTHAFVIRGLAEDVTPEEVITDLKTRLNIQAISCHKMKFERYNAKPLMLLITDSKLTLTHLQARVRYIENTKVQIERRRSSRKSVQCHNCQKWGHATSNCHAITHCMHCAGPHNTKTCTTKDKLKCTNCEKNHAANDTSCPIYTQRVKWMEENKTKHKKPQQQKEYQPQPAEFPPIKYIDAPAPQQNQWHNKQQQQQTQQTQQTQQKQQSHQQQAPQPQEQQQNTSKNTHTLPTYIGHPPTTFQQPIDSLKELMSELTTLNSLVNINGLINALKTLNAQLRESTNTLQTFTIFTNFTQTLDKYNI